MAIISSSQRRSVVALSKLHYCNPFLRHRIELEREALGSDFRDAPLVRTELDYKKDHNLEQIALHVEKQTARIRQSLVESAVTLPAGVPSNSK